MRFSCVSYKNRLSVRANCSNKYCANKEKRKKQLILILNQSYISECLSYFLYVVKNEWLCCVIITWDLARPQTKASQIIFPLYKETLYVLKYVCMYVLQCSLFFFHRSKGWLLIQFRFSNTAMHMYSKKSPISGHLIWKVIYVCTTYLVNDKSTGRFCGLFKNP